MIKTTYKKFCEDAYFDNKSFNRAKQALDNIDQIEDNVAHSVVDSVVYIKNPSIVPLNPIYKKIYHTLIYAINGKIEIEVGNKIDLQSYNDLTDEGKATTEWSITLHESEILIVEVLESYAIKSCEKDFVIAYVSRYDGIK